MVFITCVLRHSRWIVVKPQKEKYLGSISVQGITFVIAMNFSYKIELLI